VKAIADTGFIVGFGNQTDRHHEWALSLAKGITEPLITCEAVLAEAAFHLGSSSYVFSLIEDELLCVDFDLTRNLPQLIYLARRYQDRKPDLADLCVLRMSELHPQYVVLTVDKSDFTIYRRNRREAVPIVCPPGL
jgi:predicted nucleic acid-binding protein